MLSLVGGWALAMFNLRSMRDFQRRNQREFCIELIENINKFAAELDDTRDRTRAIHHEFLNLIDVEIGIFGRNRENLLLLDRGARRAMQKFMSDIAIRRVNVTRNLEEFQRFYDLSRTARAGGEDETARMGEQQAAHYLNEAHSLADKLVATAKNGRDVIEAIERA